MVALELAPQELTDRTPVLRVTLFTFGAGPETVPELVTKCQDDVAAGDRLYDRTTCMSGPHEKPPRLIVFARAGDAESTIMAAAAAETIADLADIERRDMRSSPITRMELSDHLGLIVLS